MKDIRSFLGHAGFYRRFIKDFSKIARPLTNLLAKDWLFWIENRNYLEEIITEYNISTQSLSRNVQNHDFKEFKDSVIL